MKEEQLLRGQIEDKISQCENQYIPVHTTFLDAHQQSLARILIGKRPFHGTLTFYGGYEDADRVIMACLPDYTCIEEYNPLTVIRATTSDGSRPLTHRDYLGSLVGLGIKREMTGDILVREDGADIIVLEDIAQFIMNHYVKAGRTSLSLTEHSISELMIPKQNRKIINDTVASLRLDNIIASTFKLSRSKAVEAISRGLVFVNHIEMTKADVKIAEGDVITLRGKGKVKLVEIGGKSRKDRQYIVLEQY
ncbi:RNA-binding protein YlmH [Clostridiales Family XIII bacterium PM5-7]